MQHHNIECNLFYRTSSLYGFVQALYKNKVRKILKYLIPANLGYQSLMSIIKERNKLLWDVHRKFELARNPSLGSNFEYADDNLKKIISLPINEKIKAMTDKYVETVDYMIVECNKAFNALSTYINENFCHSSPLIFIPPRFRMMLYKNVQIHLNFY